MRKVKNKKITDFHIFEIKGWVEGMNSGSHGAMGAWVGAWVESNVAWNWSEGNHWPITGQLMNDSGVSTDRR